MGVLDRKKAELKCFMSICLQYREGFGMKFEIIFQALFGSDVLAGW